MRSVAWAQQSTAEAEKGRLAPIVIVCHRQGRSNRAVPRLTATRLDFAGKRGWQRACEYLNERHNDVEEEVLVGLIREPIASKLRIVSASLSDQDEHQPARPYRAGDRP